MVGGFSASVGGMAGFLLSFSEVTLVVYGKRE